MSLSDIFNDLETETTLNFIHGIHTQNVETLISLPFADSEESQKISLIPTLRLKKLNKNCIKYL